ncbi:DUF4062 domain-containing protein [Dehalococcoidia bacterium]|nr:DUF4062 domain-containing protein [Dehalococcoidia bacterium]
MGKLRVFVSSSQAKRELEYDREIAKIAILELQLEPVMFEGLQAMSKACEDAYIDEVKNCDILVLILWKTLRSAVKREFDEALSNNRPILIFVKTLHPGEECDPYLLEFLQGIEPIDGPDRRESAPYIPFYVHYNTLEELKKRIKEGIITEISRMLAREPMTTHTRQGMYELGTRIVRSAKRRLFLFELTPCLLFGPRKVHWEQEYYDALQEWIRLVEQSSARQFLYFFDLQSTREELTRHPENRSRVKDAIATLKKTERDTTARFQLTMPSSPNYSGPMGLGDDWLAFWLVGQDDAVAISLVNAKLSMHSHASSIRWEANGLRRRNYLNFWGLICDEVVRASGEV